MVAMNHSSGRGVVSPTRSNAAVGKKEGTSKNAKRACDQCKFRKTKCTLSQPCATCTSMGFECTYLKPQKKRGPAGHRVSQILQEQQNQASQGDRSGPDVSSSQITPVPFTTTNDLDSSPSISGSNPEWPSGGDIPRSADDPKLELPVGAYESMISAPNSESISANWNDGNDIEYWLPDNLGMPTPSIGFPGSNIYVKSALPPIVNTDLSTAIGYHEDGSRQTPGLSLSSVPISPVNEIWPSFISETSLIPWIDVYFDRLHPTLPVLNRSSLISKILTREHRHNPQFGSMLLSLCAFSLTQPIDISERPTSSSRASQARLMMNEATKMRSCSDFGENPTLEAVLTSFFLFGCLFGSNQHNAAWLRLREAVDLALSLRLNDPESYQNMSSEENGQRLRTYLVLSITERAYALQKRHPISFRGKPGFSMRPTADFIHSATHSLVSGVIVHNEKDAAGMMGLALLMELFDAIDEDIIECWNGRCDAASGHCRKLDEAKAISIHQNLSHVSDAERYESNDWFDPEPTGGAAGQGGIARSLGGVLRETQCADVLVTQKWLQNRVWHLCLGHGLLKIDSPHMEMTFNYSVTLAMQTLDLCRSLRISSMEAHGIGLIEKLYNIACSALMTLHDRDPVSVADLNLTPRPSDPGLGGYEGYSQQYATSTSSLSSSHSTFLTKTLVEKYSKLLTTLRGGNHPFVEAFKNDLNALYGLSLDNEQQMGGINSNFS